MLAQQAAVGVLLGGGLACGGFARVYTTNGNMANALAISFSLFLIVLTSVVLGTFLPFALAKAGIDPANAGTSIQVIMVSRDLSSCKRGAHVRAVLTPPLPSVPADRISSEWPSPA
jgi:hypothetical protein